MITFSEMDEGKCNSLFEFSHYAAKEGGYSDKVVNSFQSMSKAYFIPMISALVGQKLVSEESEFDEAMYVLEQNSPKNLQSQLNVEQAKSGDKVEIMKFFAAFAYEFRATRPVLFTRLCESISRINQLHIAHFVSYMDNAVKAEDEKWWKILFMPYSDDDLNKLGVSISGNALNTPHKTPSRSMMTEKTMFDSPVGIVVNSPNGKDRLIQEYERRLKVERSLVQSLQVDYDESTEKMTKLKLENDMLKDKLERANKKSTQACDEDCPNKAEAVSMRVKLNIRDNKLSQLSTDLAVVREELETVSDSSNKFRLENRQLEERAKFLTDENERLTNAYNELLELRQKLATAVKEKEDLIISHSNDGNFKNKTDLLTKENDLLKRENDELRSQISTDKKFVHEIQGELKTKKICIENLTQQLNRNSKLSEANRIKPIKEPDQLVNKSLSARTAIAFTVSAPPSSRSVSMLSRPVNPNFKFTVNEEKKQDFKYNDEGRLKDLQNRNKANPPHLRSHYAVESDSCFSPSETMKFTK